MIIKAIDFNTNRLYAIKNILQTDKGIEVVYNNKHKIVGIDCEIKANFNEEYNVGDSVMVIQKHIINSKTLSEEITTIYATVESVSDFNMMLSTERFNEPISVTMTDIINSKIIIQK